MEIIKNSQDNDILAVKIEDGLSARCREKYIEEIMNDTRVTDRFNLTIRRLNRWWYLVVFNGKDVQT